MSKTNPQRSLYTYAWDIAGRDVESVVDEVLELGLDGIKLAASYHAGKFIRPPRPGQVGGRVVFPEDGALYFEPTVSRYKALPAHPHSDPAQRRVAYDLAADGRLALSAWTILFHNSRLGEMHPELTARNAWGDGYVYSLCPMQPAVFDYGVTLATDIAQTLPWQSLTLESPGWAPFNHGYHHEFAQVRSNLWLDTMLGLCFCGACSQAAQQRGIDAAGLAGRVRNRVDGYLAANIDAAPDQAGAWLAADLYEDADLAAFIKLRQNRVTEFVSTVRAEMKPEVALYVIPTVQRPTAQTWLEGSDLAALAKVSDGVEIPFYEPNAGRVIADAVDTIRRVGDAGKVCAILRPGVPDLGDGADLGGAYHGLKALGIEAFSFYNYGMLRPDSLARLRSLA
ncbi:hypothetical protein IGB42_03356 [Andreprevotia sp. IGB-42]|uniref:hypothetical protein n=1 Tax=Andreprevotia sp. IGB-42 TaxID=2497473 RepID=UPI00135797ED|nr:hypothetical protein [Andreprevotia sp. IGB-42]KAF0812079.1 hypothetical protein IGB42_03356 [Andreprevotia sp. IGB-42]